MENNSNLLQPKINFAYIERLEYTPNLNILHYNAGPIWFQIDVNSECLHVYPNTSQ